MAEVDEFLNRKTETILQDFDPKGYKKLVNNIGGLQDSLKAERQAVEDRIARLEESKQKTVDQQKNVQVMLGKQVSAANRGYQMMLGEFHSLHREYSKLHEDFGAFKEQAKEEAKQAAFELFEANKRAEAGYLERDEKIVELRAQLPELTATITGLDRVIVELKEAHSKEVVNWDALLKDARSWSNNLQGELDVERQKFVDRELEMKSLLTDTDKQRLIMIERKKHMDDVCERLETELAAEKAKVAQLEYEKATDDTAERVRKECEEDFQKYLSLKDAGFEKLMKDFVTMQEGSVRQVEGIREEAKAQITRLEKQLHAKAQECDTTKERFEKKLRAKEEECSKLLRKLMTVTQREEERRVEEESGGGEWNLMLNVAKKALQDQIEENERLKAEVQGSSESGTNEKKNYEAKIAALQANLRKLASSVEIQISAKDEEVKRVMKGIHTMRLEVDAERARSDEKEKMWLERVEAKEIAYDRLLGEVSVLERKVKRAEEYAVEVWSKVRVKEREIVAQMMRYEERLDELRKKVEVAVEEKKAIEEEVKEAKRATEEVKVYYEKIIVEQREEFVVIEKQLRMEIAELNQTIKERQQEIFDLMKEMERKEAEWKAKEEELLATIKEREREIDALKTEMKYRLEQLQAEIDELQESYDLLKRKYDADLTGDNSVASLKQSLERLQRQLKEMQSKLEALMAKVKELRQIIREKDFIIEDVKRECADIVLQKEQAYQALLKDMNKIRDEIDEERKMLQRKFYEMGQEFKKQKLMYEQKLVDLEAELEKEKQTQLIVQKLKEEIEEWKVRFAEEVKQREVITRDLRETVSVKENGIQRLIKDTFEYENKIADLKKKHEETIEGYEEKLTRKERSWLKKAHGWEKKEKALRVDIEKALYLANDPDKIRKEKERREMERQIKQKLEERVGIQAEEIAAAQVAVKEMAEENTQIRSLLAEKKGDLGKNEALLERRLEHQARRFKRLMVENEDLRQTLIGEMDKADQNLRDLEAQFLDMPNPFADEVAELRQSYEDSQSVMQQLGRENFELIAELRTVKTNAVETQKELERKLTFTIEMLNKVKAMETVKLIANADFLQDLDADGSGDVTWDEALPIFQAQGMTEVEARELFDKLDLSGDGTISQEEFAQFKAKVEAEAM